MNPEDIGKIKLPSQWKLEQEGMTFDDDGKDTSHIMYGRENKHYMPKGATAGEKNGRYIDGRKCNATDINEYNRNYYHENKERVNARRRELYKMRTQDEFFEKCD